MIEFRNGSFSDPMPTDEALEQFKDFIGTGEAKALHVGSRAELLKVKTKADQQAQIDELKERLSTIENKEPLRSDILHLPTNEDVLRFAPPEKS